MPRPVFVAANSLQGQVWERPEDAARILQDMVLSDRDEWVRGDAVSPRFHLLRQLRDIRHILTDEEQAQLGVDITRDIDIAQHLLETCTQEQFVDLRDRIQMFRHAHRRARHLRSHRSDSRWTRAFRGVDEGLTPKFRP